MPYVSIKHIERSLDYMFEHTHSALFSVLALALSGAPISDNPDDAVNSGGPAETRLMEKYFLPAGGSPDRPYFVPFGEHQGKTRWRIKKYPSSSLQRQRQERKAVFRQHPESGTKWSFGTDTIKWLDANAKQTLGDVPIIVAYLAAWSYREKEITSWEQAVEDFVVEFRLGDLGLVPAFFQIDIPEDLSRLPFEAYPVDDAVLLEVLQKSEPPKRDDVVPNEVEGSRLDVDARVVRAPPESTGNWRLEIGDLVDLEDLKGLLEPARRAVAALNAGMHVIFTGPPGTGKTSLARALLKRADFAYNIVPATDQWTTFDTIGGYFPRPQADGSERLDFMAGKIVQAIEKGECLIIDEINRADIDKAFGELFTLLTGNFVSLPYQRRWEPEPEKTQFRNIRLQFGPAQADEADDVIPVPIWWRLIGSMNDSDKASLKKLSMAFVRRFAFVPVDIPERSVFEDLIREWGDKTAAARAGREQIAAVVNALVALFADTESGFAKIGMPLGPSFAKSAIEYVDSELYIDPTRSSDDLLLSAFELHIMPQFQGRPDLHEPCRELVGPFVGGEMRVDAHLAVWTGYI